MTILTQEQNLVEVSSKDSECSMSSLIQIHLWPSSLDSCLCSEVREYDTKTSIKLCDTLGGEGSLPDYNPTMVSHSLQLWH